MPLSPVTENYKNDKKRRTRLRVKRIDYKAVDGFSWMQFYKI